MGEPGLSSTIGIPVLVAGAWRGPGNGGEGAVSLAELLCLPLRLNVFLGRLAGVSGVPWPGWSPSLSLALRAEFEWITRRIQAWQRTFPGAAHWEDLVREDLGSWQAAIERAMNKVEKGRFGWPAVFELRETLTALTGKISRAEEETRTRAWEFSYYLNRNLELVAQLRDKGGDRAARCADWADQLHQWGRTPPAEIPTRVNLLQEMNRKLALILGNTSATDPGPSDDRPTPLPSSEGLPTPTMEKTGGAHGHPSPPPPGPNGATPPCPSTTGLGPDSHEGGNGPPAPGWRHSGGPLHEEIRFCRAFAGYLHLGSSQPRFRKMLEEAGEATDAARLAAILGEARRLLQKLAEVEMRKRQDLRHLQAYSGLLPNGDPLQEVLAQEAQKRDVSHTDRLGLAKEVEASFARTAEQEDRLEIARRLIPLLSRSESLAMRPEPVDRLAGRIQEGQIVALPKGGEHLLLVRFSPDQEFALRLIRLVPTARDKETPSSGELDRDEVQALAWQEEVQRLLQRLPEEGILWVERWRGGPRVDRMTPDQLEQAGVDLRGISLPRGPEGGPPPPALDL